ncbi:MAG TPA: YezD family protein [Chitinispirillaceae bacterium]|nr:YezD family protein [Chitinispirillaceae bacterium]
MNTKENNSIKNQAEKVAARISNTLRGLRYGSVVLTVHDSRIVQIERIEKSRFEDLYLENGDRR